MWNLPSWVGLANKRAASSVKGNPRAAHSSDAILDECMKLLIIVEFQTIITLIVVFRSFNFSGKSLFCIIVWLMSILIMLVVWIMIS